MGTSRAAVVTVEEKLDGVHLMAFSDGEVDVATCQDIHDRFNSKNHPGDGWIFDLRVPYLESEPVKSILTLVDTVRTSGGEAAIICNKSFYSAHRVLDTLRIGRIIPIASEVEAALELCKK